MQGFSVFKQVVDIVNTRPYIVNTLNYILRIVLYRCETTQREKQTEARQQCAEKI
jgi:hypothetical protein